MSASAGDANGSVAIEGATSSMLIGNEGDSFKTSDKEWPTFSAYASSVAIAQNKSMLSLVNTTGSTVVIRIREIFVFNVQTTAVAGIVANFQLLRCATHTGGTALTIEAHDTSDTLDGSVTARTGATIGTEGTGVLNRWLWSTDEFGAGTADAETYEHTMAQLTPGYVAYPKTKPITLRANQGLTIKQITNSTNGTFDVQVVFTQES